MLNRASGLHYHRFLKRLHENNLFDWYLEVGCRDGASFANVASKTIAVDPFFRADINIIGAKPALHVFQQTSDDFFASDFLKRNKIQLSVSFLDGMHLIEFLLRDFIATEARSNPDGVILMHDTAPFDTIMTMRDFRQMPKDRGFWTGDVWKIWPILQEYRPDLELTMFDCRPTGMMAVRNLKPKSQILVKKYDEICARFQDLTLDDYGVDKFANAFEFTPASEYSKEGFPMFQEVRMEPAKDAAPRFVSP